MLRAAVRLALLLAVVGVAMLAVLGWQINHVGSQDNAHSADAVVILGARVHPDGTPGSDLLSRTYHAVDLFQAGKAPVVICAGGSAGDRLAAGAVACRFAVEELGLSPAQAVVVDQVDAFTTADEAWAVADLMRVRGWESAILVSHPLHLYRARWLFERQGLDISTSPTNTNLWRIFPPLRLWYTLREAGGVILIAVQEWLPMEGLRAGWGDVM